MQTQETQNLGELVTKDTWQRFDDFLRSDYWKVTHRHLSEKSIKLAAQHIRVFGLWWEAKFHEVFEADKATNYDLQIYRKWSLETEKVRAATWNSRLWALGIFSLMVNRADLLEGIEQKASVSGSTRHRSLTIEEYHRLVHALEQSPHRAVTIFEHWSAVRDAAAISLMLFAGLRVEEVSLLDVDDCSISERSGMVLVRNGKGNKERTVPLNLMVRKALKTWLELRSKAEGDALFIGKDMKRLTTRTFQRVLHSMGQQIRVPGLTPHWLRYTFAKRMELSNVSIEAIRDLLGHTSIETTRRYLRSSLDELNAAVEVAL